MHCHTHSKNCHGSLAVDARFEDDDFTQAAVRERKLRAAHTHSFTLLMALVGIAFFHSAHRRFRTRR